MPVKYFGECYFNFFHFDTYIELYSKQLIVVAGKQLGLYFFETIRLLPRNNGHQFVRAI